MRPLRDGALVVPDLAVLEQCEQVSRDALLIEPDQRGEVLGRLNAHRSPAFTASKSRSMRSSE